MQVGYKLYSDVRIAEKTYEEIDGRKADLKVRKAKALEKLNKTKADYEENQKDVATAKAKMYTIEAKWIKQAKKDNNHS